MFFKDWSLQNEHWKTLEIKNLLSQYVQNSKTYNQSKNCTKLQNAPVFPNFFCIYGFMATCGKNFAKDKLLVTNFETKLTKVRKKQTFQKRFGRIYWFDKTMTLSLIKKLCRQSCDIAFSSQNLWLIASRRTHLSRRNIFHSQIGLSCNNET